ncbi:hypothetical protein Aeqsu_2577 [Aequorivita sublithincola DSM 14238]|uniref:Secretion system C-terminal sorting domain-containing protein n=1 Tax=Aequorivita sublithincola (strain DSM 14238 / LMG 21431 / ACAM 643 / 9-3) TaxID=746697 RepID=I3YYG4_AEQSU|nr:T9SS type A sorting domain-containing protein [Aequorivita sublithincola]AFL82032.1 hypothetical protein Aeqsu_2577 [Aequorivita sublithincola DSM 14238]
MKKITLFVLLFANFALFAQKYQIQLRLVDGNIGYPTGNSNAPSNDPSLNAIFGTYGITGYLGGTNPVPDWEFRTHFVLCTGCDINALKQALDNYSTVVENTVQNEPGYIANALYVKLIDLDNGYNTGDVTPEGIVITNNSVLNTIFVDHTVLYFEPAFPGIQNPELKKVFQLGCDCMAVDLGPVLEAEPEIIEDTERQGYAVLAVADSEKLDFQFYPNPVENAIIIDSSERITSFEIINPLGQSIFKGNSNANINSFLPSLSIGNYLLKVATVSGKIQIVRFMKK